MAKDYDEWDSEAGRWVPKGPPPEDEDDDGSQVAAYVRPSNTEAAQATNPARLSIRGRPPAGLQRPLPPARGTVLPSNTVAARTTNAARQNTGGGPLAGLRRPSASAQGTDVAPLDRRGIILADLQPTRDFIFVEFITTFGMNIGTPYVWSFVAPFSSSFIEAFMRFQWFLQYRNGRQPFTLAEQRRIASGELFLPASFQPAPVADWVFQYALSTWMDVAGLLHALAARLHWQAAPQQGQNAAELYLSFLSERSAIAQAQATDRNSDNAFQAPGRIEDMMSDFPVNSGVPTSMATNPEFSRETTSPAANQSMEPLQPGSDDDPIPGTIRTSVTSQPQKKDKRPRAASSAARIADVNNTAQSGAQKGSAASGNYPKRLKLDGKTAAAVGQNPGFAHSAAPGAAVTVPGGAFNALMTSNIGSDPFAYEYRPTTAGTGTGGRLNAPVSPTLGAHQIAQSAAPVAANTDMGGGFDAPVNPTGDTDQSGPQEEEKTRHRKKACEECRRRKVGCPHPVPDEPKACKDCSRRRVKCKHNI